MTSAVAGDLAHGRRWFWVERFGRVRVEVEIVVWQDNGAIVIPVDWDGWDGKPISARLFELESEPLA